MCKHHILLGKIKRCGTIAYLELFDLIDDKAYGDIQERPKSWHYENTPI